MDAHEDPPRIQVLSVSDTGRRRRWTDDEKVRIVEESHRDGVTLAEVARRHEISRSQLYDWRYRHKHGMLDGGRPRKDEAARVLVTLWVIVTTVSMVLRLGDGIH